MGTTIQKWNGNRVAVSLMEIRTTAEIFWSPRPSCSSYVLAEPEGPAGAWKTAPWYAPDGRPCLLVSVNGGGEVRWSVRPAEKIYDADQAAAVAHFGLTLTPPPAPAPKAVKPVTIRSNAKGTVNRAQLRKLVEAGRIEARVDYSYDDMSGTSVGSEWLPAILGDGRTGIIGFDEFDFDSSSGRAYLRESQSEPGKQRVILRVHSNLIYELRVAS
jgi:hypothetical protein